MDIMLHNFRFFFFFRGVLLIRRDRRDECVGGRVETRDEASGYFPTVEK